ncbi:MAG: diacylglycerol kinase family protein [bacterium]
MDERRACFFTPGFDGLTTMAEYFKTKFVVNPRSANGRTLKIWPQIEQTIHEYLPNFDHEFTKEPRDATRITAEALKAGYEMIVCIGGDGTINETVNGFFENGKLIKEDAVLGILCMGTGCDFIKTSGIPRDFKEGVKLLSGRDTQRCDVGHVTLQKHDGETAEHYFINITDFGMGGDVVYRVNNSSKFLRGFMSFLLGMAKSQIYYRNKIVQLEVDGKPIGERRIKNVIVANGQYFAGGMRIAKNARLDSGKFDVIIMGDMNIKESIKWIRKLYTGDIIEFTEKVEYFHASHVKANSEDDVMIDMDGEQPGKLPIELKIIPGAIRLKAPAPQN